MSRLRSLNRSWLFVLTTPISLASTLSAAEPMRCSQDPPCRNHVDKAIALDAAQKYEPALHEFQAAYKQQKEPRLALNIGRTLHKLGRFAEALSWYRDIGRAAPADIELQKQLQEFTAQARQNLPAAPVAGTTVTVVSQPPFNVQISPVHLTSMAAIAHPNDIKIDLGTMPSGTHKLPVPLHKRAALWAPLVGIALAAGAAGIAAATWQRPWQPEAHIPASSFPVLTVGGAK